MKNLVLCVATVVALASCDMVGGGNERLKAENDSLMVVLSQRNAELDEMMGTFNDISEGFRQINAAEHRVDLQRYDVGEGSLSAREKMADDIEFIRKQMEENREQIAKLQEMLKKSNNNSAQLKKAVAKLTEELETKTRRIAELKEELAAKNIRIQELDEAVTGLTADKNRLQEENVAKSNTVAQQDKELNAAWFVFGTAKELEEQNILKDRTLFSKGKVLKDSDFNKNYFTQIDIRTTNLIKLYAKSAKLRTSHPDGSYTLEKDSKGEYELKITDAKAFWSVSRYLVIQVK